jgi:hypothetical protein
MIEKTAIGDPLGGLEATASYNCINGCWANTHCSWTLCKITPVVTENDITYGQLNRNFYGVIYTT